MKIVPFLLAALFLTTAPALADHRDPGHHHYDLYAAAADVKADAEALLITLAHANIRYPNRAVFNAGMTAKEANDIVELLDGNQRDLPLGYLDDEVQEVLQAFSFVAREIYNIRNGYVQEAFYRLSSSIDRLSYATGNGGGGHDDDHDDGDTWPDDGGRDDDHHDDDGHGH